MHSKTVKQTTKPLRLLTLLPSHSRVAFNPDSWFTSTDGFTHTFLPTACKQSQSKVSLFLSFLVVLGIQARSRSLPYAKQAPYHQGTLQPQTKDSTPPTYGGGILIHLYRDVSETILGLGLPKQDSYL